MHRNPEKGLTSPSSRITVLAIAVIALVWLPACNDGNKVHDGNRPDDQVYGQFQAVAGNSRIDLGKHRTYTEEYVASRAHLFCNLLAQGNMTDLTKEIAFPPVVHWTETTTDRPRLEAAILGTGPPTYCPAYTRQARQWLATYTR